MCLVFVKISAQQQDRTKEGYFFMRAKHIISYFEGISRGARIVDSQIIIIIGRVCTTYMVL
jgi:hypothetical protein